MIDRGGHDDIRTGAGNDEIEARDGRAVMRIWCGAGNDDAAIVDHRDRSRATDCEHLIIPLDEHAP